MEGYESKKGFLISPRMSDCASDSHPATRLAFRPSTISISFIFRAAPARCRAARMTIRSRNFQLRLFLPSSGIPFSRARPQYSMQRRQGRPRRGGPPANTNYSLRDGSEASGAEPSVVKRMTPLASTKNPRFPVVPTAFGTAVAAYEFASGVPTIATV